MQTLTVGACVNRARDIIAAINGGVLTLTVLACIKCTLVIIITIDEIAEAISRVALIRCAVIIIIAINVIAWVSATGHWFIHALAVLAEIHCAGIAILTAHCCK
jgi:hypothetical protein